MRDKKGILEKNVLSIVIAIAGLTILVLGFIVGCERLLANEETEAAKDTADLIKGKIDALEDGQNVKTLIRGIETDDDKAWYIIGFSKNEINAPDIETCFLSSCVCVCKESYSRVPIAEGEPVLSRIELEKFSVTCANLETGFCRKIDKDNVNVKTTRYIRELSSSIERPYIPLKEPLLEISFTKKENSIEIILDEK